MEGFAVSWEHHELRDVFVLSTSREKREFGNGATVYICNDVKRVVTGAHVSFLSLNIDHQWLNSVTMCFIKRFGKFDCTDTKQIKCGIKCFKTFCY